MREFSLPLQKDESSSFAGGIHASNQKLASNSADVGSMASTTISKLWKISIYILELNNYHS